MAGIGALAHGNDIGGSLRFPAAANGAVTVKPGLGRVPAWNPSQKASAGCWRKPCRCRGSSRARRRSAPVHARDDRARPARSVPRAAALARPAARRADPRGGQPPTISASACIPRWPGARQGRRRPSRRRLCGRGGRAAACPRDRRAGYRALMGEVKALMGPISRPWLGHAERDLRRAYYAEFPPFEGTELLPCWRGGAITRGNGRFFSRTIRLS
jgi:amidase